MATDRTLFLPSSAHFRRHSDSVAERLSNERFEAAVRRLAALREIEDDENDEGRRLAGNARPRAAGTDHGGVR